MHALRREPRRAATLRLAGASEGCRFAAARPNNVRQYYVASLCLTLLGPAAAKRGGAAAHSVRQRELSNLLSARSTFVD